MKSCFLKFLALLPAAFLLLGSRSASAQTNIQVFYDFGSDRQFVTTTLEGFYSDSWGNTFFFVDHDFNSKTADGKVYAPSGTYMEIARCLNFWTESALAPLSLHLEYNGGVYEGYTINNAFLAGLDYFLHSDDFSNTFNFKVLYKYIHYTDASLSSQVPLQLTLVWTMQDLFGLKGLCFTGFADYWWEDHYLYSDHSGAASPELARSVFTSEPQLWYNVGQHFACEQLHLGTELELSYNFDSKGFWCRPCLGLKWIF